MNDVNNTAADESLVLRFKNADHQSVVETIGKYGLTLRLVSPDDPIPGSFWGDEEAGLIGTELYASGDTPVHSILHETCHYICMDRARREGLHTNAGGDYDEENAVCYLQIVLADHIRGMGRQRMLEDMDNWGYNFRLGCAEKWFEQDAEDALGWLLCHQILDAQHQPSGQLRGV